MQKKLPYLIFASLVFLVYANTIFQSFHFDDIPSILQKPWIRGLDKIPQFILSLNQRPLTILSLNVNYAISEFNVWSYHVFNILFHTGTVLLVFQLGKIILKTYEYRRPEIRKVYRNAPTWAAVFFALHPLNTQSVTYISSRSSVLATLFFLSALALLIRAIHEWFPKAGGNHPAQRKKRLVRLICAMVLWGLGFLCKEIVITLPAIAFLFHYFFISQLNFAHWLKNQFKWITLGLVVLLGAIGLRNTLMGKLLASSPTNYSTPDYLLTQSFVIPFEYLRKLLWPVNLNIDIGFPIITDWSHPENWLGILTLVFLIIGLVKITDSWIQFGLFWGLITLMPTSSFIPLLDPAVEHRMYLPMAGFCLATGAAVCQLEKTIRATILTGPFSRLALWRTTWTGWFVMVVLMAAMTTERNRNWQSEVTLWSDSKKKSPHIVRPFNNLGEAYDKQKNYNKAIAEFKNALKLNPNYVFALGNIGNVLGKMGQYEKAKTYFRRALQVKPDYAPAHYNLARALSLTGKKKKAKDHYLKAVEIKPFFEKAWFNLAFTESEIGEHESAIKHYKKFLEFQPRYAKAWFGLGMSYFKQGEFEQAIEALLKATQNDDRYLAPRINLAAIYLQQNQVEQALKVYKKLLLEVGNIPGVHKNLGILYGKNIKNPLKAAYHFREALRLEPSQPQAEAMKQMILRWEEQVIKKNLGKTND